MMSGKRAEKMCLNAIFLAFDPLTYLILSLILCKALEATLNPSSTIIFKTCALHLT